MKYHSYLYADQFGIIQHLSKNTFLNAKTEREQFEILSDPWKGIRLHNTAQLFDVLSLFIQSFILLHKLPLKNLDFPWTN